MRTEIFVIIGLAALLVFFLYGMKYCFRTGSRVRYLAIYKQDDRYMSHDAFWKCRYLKRGIIGPFGRPCGWSFVPVIANRRRITDDVSFVARGYFGSKRLLLSGSKPIKCLYRLNPKYHISTHMHFNAGEDSRRILHDVPFDGKIAEVDYAKNYLVLFEDDTGYVMKIRK